MVGDGKVQGKRRGEKRGKDRRDEELMERIGKCKETEGKER